MQTVENSRLSGVMSDEEIAMLRQRNEERAKQKAAEMGESWLLHPNAKPRNYSRIFQDRLTSENKSLD